jgi:hypothetical protein
MVVGAGDIAIYCGPSKAVRLRGIYGNGWHASYHIVHMTRPYTSFLLN